ncbi:MAG: HAD family hydrolase [Verrucomicrobia bacterium]|nr:HAD family hydrolase [Verrucomicrobiota bacterium]
MDQSVSIIPKRPEAILFDLGSTLLQDSNSGALNTRVRTLLKSETFAPYVEEGFDLPTALADAMESMYRGNLDEFHVRKWLESHLMLIHQDQAESLERAIRSTIISYSPPQDASRVLRALMSLGIPMAVVSNTIFSADLLRSDLEEHSVLEAFRFVVSSAEFGLRKPHPQIFKDAVKQLGSGPSSTWYVGDLWENDVMGSTAAGLVPVWLNAHASIPDVSVAHWRVRNWTEFGELVGV